MFAQKPKSIPRWLVVALLSVVGVTLMAWQGLPQTIVAIAANTLFVICVIVGIFERRAKLPHPPSARWIDFDKAQSVSFLIAPIGTALKKYLSVIGGDLQADRQIDPATYIEILIGTVLLDWRGVTRDGKALNFNYENAKAVLAESEAILDFVCNKAVDLEDGIDPNTSDSTSSPAQAPPPPELPADPRPMWNWASYTLPGLDLLDEHRTETRAAAGLGELKRIQDEIGETLAAFDIAASPGPIAQGTAAIGFQFQLERVASSADIKRLERLLPDALDVDWVRIDLRSDDQTELYVEIPIAGRANVSLKQLLLSQDWKTFKESAHLPIAFGRQTNGEPLVADLSELPHLLIAGTTGSGKSACIDTMVIGLLLQFTPEELRFVLVDMRAQMHVYESLPHLAFPIIYDPTKVLLGLRWLIDEMERRYKMFARLGVRSIDQFNRRAANTSCSLNASHSVDVIPNRLPFVVVIVDDLADAMQILPVDIEVAVARVTQLGRATGVHMIIATQIPRADVITGVVKANMPARIAFKVASKLDSRLILDSDGAERLLGEGDMLYLGPNSASCIRAQGAFVTDEEIRRVVEFVSKQSPPAFDTVMHEKLQSATAPEEEVTEEDEELVEKCLEIIRQEKRASTSLLQRRLRLGYTRAARIVDILEQRGILGPGEGAKPREILIDLDAAV